MKLFQENLSQTERHFVGEFENSREMYGAMIKASGPVMRLWRQDGMIYVDTGCSFYYVTDFDLIDEMGG